MSAQRLGPGPEGQERRRYFRIRDDVHLDVRVVPEAQYEEVVAAPPREGDDPCDLVLQLRTLTTQARVLLAGIRKDDPDVAQYLALQDRKLDLLARAVVGSQLDKSLEVNARVDVSAGGVSFQASKEVPEETKVLVRLVFFPSHLCVQAYGRVVHAERDDHDAEKPYRIGVEFTVISETARDALVRHTLERQSEQLRRQRSGE